MKLKYEQWNLWKYETWYHLIDYIYVIDGKKSIFLVVLAETLMQTTLDKEHKDKIITHSA